MLKLRLFGKGEASFLEQPLVCFPNQQPYLLLCYLLLNPMRPHPRDQLAALFWGEQSTAISRKNLRNGIWRLRNAFHMSGAEFEDYVIVSDDSVSFFPSADYWLDVAVFTQHIQKCQDVAGYEVNAQQAANLQEAVDLYTGDLMDGVTEDWCLYDRERLRLMYLNALIKLMAYHEQHSSYEIGLDCGARILQRDNTHELVHHHMMRFYWLLGDRHSALAQYKRCAQILKEELGIAPMREMTETYHQMVNNTFAPTQRPHSGQLSVPGRTLPPAGSLDGSSGSMMEQALLTIQRLEAAITEANEELRAIKNLIQNLASLH